MTSGEQASKKMIDDPSVATGISLLRHMEQASGVSLRHVQVRHLEPEQQMIDGRYHSLLHPWVKRQLSLGRYQPAQWSLMDHQLLAAGVVSCGIATDDTMAWLYLSPATAELWQIDEQVLDSWSALDRRTWLQACWLNGWFHSGDN